MLAAMEQPREESDQLPEEGPPGQVVDDEPGDAREEAEETPGRPDEGGAQTGNPESAGEDDDA
jgi:hypothetical protein